MHTLQSTVIYYCTSLGHKLFTINYRILNENNNGLQIMENIIINLVDNPKRVNNFQISRTFLELLQLSNVQFCR